MKKNLLVILALALVIPFTFTMAFAGAGNQAPSGPHYNLNIVGVSKDKTALMKDDGVTGQYGHVIFVPLDSEGTLEPTKILLKEGPDFQVLDKNGTDGDGAKFQLPVADTGVILSRESDTSDCTLYNADGTRDSDQVVDPGTGDYYICGSGTTVYSVFARALGKRGTPGTDAIVMLCGTDYTTDPPTEVCSTTNQLTLDSYTRPGKFTNVTANLLYLYNVDFGGVHYKRIPLFSDALQDYFWSYDNNGLKLLQLRFYWCSTIVPEDWPGPIDDSACFASK